MEAEKAKAIAIPNAKYMNFVSMAAVYRCVQPKSKGRCLERGREAPYSMLKRVPARPDNSPKNKRRNMAAAPSNFR